MARHWRTSISVPASITVGSLLTAVEKVREYGRCEVKVGASLVVLIAEWTEERDWDLRGAIDETATELRALGFSLIGPDHGDITDVPGEAKP